MKRIEVSISEATFEKIAKIETIDGPVIDTDLDWKLSRIASMYMGLIKCGLRDLDGKLTWNEIQYMLACIDASFYGSNDVNFITASFLHDLTEFLYYDYKQATEFCIDSNKLVAKLQRVHPVSCFALLSLLVQCWVVKNIDGDARAYVEKELDLVS